MDVAYDHVQEEILPDSEPKDGSAEAKSNLNTEFQEAFKAVQASPWGATLGGWFGQVRKQGEDIYQGLQKEATERSEQATKGLTSLREQVTAHTKNITLSAEPAPEIKVPGEEGIPDITTTAVPTVDIVKEAGSLVASLRSTAAAKLKDLQAAEDAADEALLKFGTNVRNFLRDAVVITAPGEDDENKPRGRDAAGNEVLFETQEPGTGKKVFHSTRLDAQLHAIHTTASSFTENPQGSEWTEWEKTFDVAAQTDAIAADLESRDDLRRAMETLVPEKVDYRKFWMRYFFLRKAIEEEESKRREVLKGAAGETEEEVGWDDDDDEDDDAEEAKTPSAASKPFSQSTATLDAPVANDLLKPKSPRRSEDEVKSVAGSDASYDMVPGATPRTAGSPKEDSKKGHKDESDEDDDWE